MKRDHLNDLRETEARVSNKYVTEINENKTRYERMISDLQQSMDPEADKKINILVEELDRLNMILNQYRDDNNQLRLRNGELERTYPQI